MDITPLAISSVWNCIGNTSLILSSNVIPTDDNLAWFLADLNNATTRAQVRAEIQSALDPFVSYIDTLATQIICDSSNNKLYAINSIVSEKDESSLDFLLNKTELPHDFDILSIDIDGNDYMVWKSFNNYKPKIVIIEANSAIPNDIEYVGGEIIESDHSIVEGSSCLSLLKLGVEKGYTLICHTGNMIFVRNDLIDKCNLVTDEEKNNPECLFLNSWKRPWNKELSTWK